MKNGIDFVAAATEVVSMAESLEKAITLLKYAYSGQTGYGHYEIDDALIALMNSKSHIANFRESEEAKSK